MLRDRVKELRRIPARELRPNPRNWRMHPERQRLALEGVLQEIGFAGAVLARECADGSLELIDGHLRAEMAPDQIVPVLILDVDEHEAGKILATHDPLAAMAEVNGDQLEELIRETDFASEHVQAMLADLNKACTGVTTEPAGDESALLSDRYQILVDCRDEEQQTGLLKRLLEEGYECRALIA